MGGILTLLKSAKLSEYGRNCFVFQDFCFCQDFVSMEKEILKSAGGKLIALKKQPLIPSVFELINF